MKYSGFRSFIMRGVQEGGGYFHCEGDVYRARGKAFQTCWLILLTAHLLVASPTTKLSLSASVEPPRLALTISTPPQALHAGTRRRSGHTCPRWRHRRTCGCWQPWNCYMAWWSHSWSAPG